MVAARSFGAALGLLRFGCATYQHRPQITGVHNAGCAAARASKQQQEVNWKYEDVPASCLARMMAAAFSLAFCCSEPDI
jgi:hypothetical protein